MYSEQQLVYSICKQLEIEIVEAPIQADAYLECENGNSYIVLTIAWSG